MSQFWKIFLEARKSLLDWSYPLMNEGFFFRPFSFFIITPLVWRFTALVWKSNVYICICYLGIFCFSKLSILLFAKKEIRGTTKLYKPFGQFLPLTWVEFFRNLKTSISKTFAFSILLDNDIQISFMFFFYILVLPILVLNNDRDYIFGTRK